MAASENDGSVVWTPRTDDLAWREIDDEVILLDLRSAEYLRLNESGSLLWMLLQPGRTAGQLAESLAERFDLSDEQAVTDVAGFLESCGTKGLLQPQEP
jgi:hypothetical protein